MNVRNPSKFQIRNFLVTEPTLKHYFFFNTETRLLGDDFDANENQQLQDLPQSDFSRIP